ncbi:GAF and ANTAR domain-containing protein [Dactylosporangium vinaceum]|uniref:GAF and ANTAR domain-containing protein n=1 Tax=Dactylosporangium vinaceum TaxID=53362 RepID=A0ABV5MKT1_9ACTN|nr:GAF and ANTAR domain-containing protein [Dactylosporangium vinaceum]UAB93942.1 GAF and ANTAR domain-containing protein [Dactylosporangium vinaceum]
MVQPLLADAFVEMADTLVDDFDLLEFLHTLTVRCVQLLDVDAAGLLLTDGQGTLQVVAASSERTRLLELFQLQTDQGPCLDCFRTATPVSVVDLPTAGQWPRFTAAAAEVGFAAVHALPMRLRHDVLGALNLFTVAPGPLDAEKLRIGQALADIATVGLLQQRAIHHRDVLTEQLQTALNSRVLIEQAKGLIAERLHVSLPDAFDILRGSARNRNRRLADTAQAVINGTESPLDPHAGQASAHPGQAGRHRASRPAPPAAPAGPRPGASS